ncbi:MAG: TRAP transporter small permease subunit [Gammaproteobacteria bacterium]
MQLNRFVSIIDAVSEWTGRAAAWLTLGMVLIGCAVVGLRYVLDTGWIWMQESVTWMHALVFLIGAAYTLKWDEHVRVDVLYRAWPERRQALLNVLGTLFLLLPMCVFLILWSYGYVASSWAVLESSREAGGLPGIFLLKTTLPAMAVLLGLQGIAELLRNLLILIGRPVTHEHYHRASTPL